MIKDEEILEIVKQVVIVDKNHTGTGDYMDEFIIEFARLIAQRQRELDAEICMARYRECLEPEMKEIAAAILAQGEIT